MLVKLFPHPSFSFTSQWLLQPPQDLSFLPLSIWELSLSCLVLEIYSLLQGTPSLGLGLVMGYKSGRSTCLRSQLHLCKWQAFMHRWEAPFVWAAGTHTRVWSSICASGMQVPAARANGAMMWCLDRTNAKWKYRMEKVIYLC